MANSCLFTRPVTLYIIYRLVFTASVFTKFLRQISVFSAAKYWFFNQLVAFFSVCRQQVRWEQGDCTKTVLLQAVKTPKMTWKTLKIALKLRRTSELVIILIQYTPTIKPLTVYHCYYYIIMFNPKWPLRDFVDISYIHEGRNGINRNGGGQFISLYRHFITVLCGFGSLYFTFWK